VKEKLSRPDGGRGNINASFGNFTSDRSTVAPSGTPAIIGKGIEQMKSTKTNRHAGDQPVPDTQVERRTISVEEAGRILGVSRGAAYAYAKEGSLPTIRLGKRLLVPKTALNKMLQID